VTTSAVFAGMVAGISVALILMLTGRDPYFGFNAGFIALCSNFAVTGLASLVTKVRTTGFDEIVPTPAASPSTDSQVIL